MPTKAQAKTAVDQAATDSKADIDLMPPGVNISDGAISFGPERYTIQLNAGGNAATAASWFNSIVASLIAAGRTPVVSLLQRRGSDSPKGYIISEAKLTVTITNF